MNQDQWLAILRPVVTALCGALVTKGIINAADAPVYATLLQTLLPGLVAAAMLWWSNHVHSDAQKTLAASSVPGVQVTVNPNAAPQKVIDVALDKSNPVALAA